MWPGQNMIVYYFTNKKTKKLVIAIIYVNDVCFMGLKDSLLLLELKIYDKMEIL